MGSTVTFGARALDTRSGDICGAAFGSIGVPAVDLKRARPSGTINDNDH
jgi:hypothetical protein